MRIDVESNADATMPKTLTHYLGVNVKSKSGSIILLLCSTERNSMVSLAPIASSAAGSVSPGLHWEMRKWTASKVKPLR